MNFLTCKITDNYFLLAYWQDLKVIKFKRYSIDYACRITLIAKMLKLQMNDIFYFDSTSKYNQYFTGAFKIKLDRQPIRKENYKNLKHQLYFMFLKSINEHQLKIECEFPRDEFNQELNQMEINKYSENNKLEIIPRRKIIENIGRDIDLIDLLSYRFFAVLRGIG